ncbi:hypothetical protein IC235_16460 [Hymenobacter sp. BT664]|uniref:Uncharacterized protein n=1 Tax=Hymenobacter montanus TaxID=2771359 RepID=A0A927GKE5_9BACT|nr:hypothetical protein [Hymenobacter montanus]MBD2769482.1 hypothetical protein [Hymenobacter montanus]
MIHLIPEKVDFRISTTGVEVLYTEAGGAIITLDTQKRSDYFATDRYTRTHITFDIVAELKCIKLNFYEFNYDNYSILRMEDTLSGIEYWQKYAHTYENGFYSVSNSEILNKMSLVYDPQKRLNLKHYLIICYDSYIELVASGYTLKEEY